jgi:hypothetical protein
MKKYPNIIASHIVRSAKRVSHGGLYLVDLNSNKYKCVIDWNEKINWSGRGADRGLRGICIYKDNVIVASSSSIVFYSFDFKRRASYSNEYLESCHETYIHKDKLYLSSTGRDVILCFDLLSRKFIKGYSVRGLKSIKEFNPLQSVDIPTGDRHHINNVFVNDSGIFFSGTNQPRLFKIDKQKIISFSQIPKGTHNTRFLNENSLIMNDTKNNQILITDKKNGSIKKRYSIKRIPAKDMTNTHLTQNISRQPFGRGLALKGDWIIGGSTPGMISLYDMKRANSNIKNVFISNDLCMSIHGLEIWPFDIDF